MTQYTMFVKKLVHFPNDGLINYATEHSSGIDLIAAIDSALVLQPGKWLMVPTGISIAFDDQRLEAQVRSRSGLAYKNGVVVLNSPGTIDNDYRGEIKIILMNMGEKDFIIEPKMRIAQMVIAKYEKVNIEFKPCLDEFSTIRGEGGFGSTGTDGSVDGTDDTK